MRKIAVVILNYNSSGDCRKCVLSLKCQQGVDAELIIVDNRSTAQDKDALRQLCADQGCTLLENDKNAGYSAGNNTGLRYAASKGYQYALIANPDMLFPQADYLAALVSIMDSDAKTAVVGSDIVGVDGIHQSPMLRDGGWRGSFGWITGIFGGRKGGAPDFIDNYAQSHYCHKVSGCCFLIRVSLLETIGFFDEYPFLYCEEAILSRQVEMAGSRMFYTADSQAIHMHVKSAKGNPLPRFKQWKRSRTYFIKRYSGDNWFGTQISVISLSIQVLVMCLGYRVKKMPGLFAAKHG